jgi:hypothetical protein
VMGPVANPLPNTTPELFGCGETRGRTQTHESAVRTHVYTRTDPKSAKATTWRQGIPAGRLLSEAAMIGPAPDIRALYNHNHTGRWLLAIVCSAVD